MRTACVLAASAALLVGLAAACTGDDSESEGPTTSTGATIHLTQPSAALKVKIVQMDGGVKAADRERINQAIARPITAWINGGFIGVEYPQSSFPDAFKSWTRGAGAQARHDNVVTTNAAIGANVIATVADRAAARLYVFATDGLTGGATARVTLRFTSEREDASLVHYLVRGSLYLTRQGSHWRIFGYQLSREDLA